MPPGKRKRSAITTHPLFLSSKKATTDAALKPLSLSKAWMRCSEGFDRSQEDEAAGLSEQTPKSVCHSAQAYVFDEENSADESLKDPADIVWSSSDSHLSDDGSKDSDSQPDIAELSPLEANNSQDADLSFTTQGCSGSGIPSITEWQDDSDLECDQNLFSVCEAAESAVEISDSESSDLFVSQQKSDMQPSKAIDIVEYLSDDPLDEPTLQPIQQCISPSDENVLSSGKSASDWLKTAQTLLQTPEKKPDRNFKTPEDSAKKRKRFIRGGLAERLSRLQNRERSAITFWRLQCESDSKIPLGDKSGTLILKILEVHEECSVHVALCEQLTGLHKDENLPASVCKDGEKLMALFTRHTAAQLKLGPKDIIHIYPPWQKITIKKHHASVILSTYFSRKTVLSTENNVSCSSVMAVTKRLVPLSQVFKLHNGKGDLDGQQQMSSTTSIHIQSPFSNKQKDITSSIVNDSLLDVVESQRVLGQKACLRVVVQRVYCLTVGGRPDCLLGRSHYFQPTANSEKPAVRICLLVQDAYGMFSELHVQYANTPIDDIRDVCQTFEGKGCCLYGVKILQRTTRGRAPGLFSLIDSLWPPLAPIKIHGQSQEQGQVLDSLPAPSFCYVLSVYYEDRCNNIKAEEEMSELYLPPVIHSLESIIQMEDFNQRCSFWATVIYIRPEVQNKHPVQEFRLYVTDTTIQAAPEASGIPSVICVCVLPSCVIDSSVIEALSTKTQCSIFFKDAVKENERIMCVERSVLSLQNPLLSCVPGTDKLTGPVRLDELDSATEVNSLCTVKGVVSGVNERESFSWPVCNLCGSNKLQPLESDRRSFFCRQCTMNISSPVIRMRLQVFLLCKLRTQCKVKVQLLQETISSILSSCSSEDGRYQVSSVLGMEVGPVHCWVQSAHSLVELEEINLLQSAMCSTGDALDFAM